MYYYTNTTPTNYLQLLPPTNLQMIEGNQSHQQNITPPEDCGETKHQKTFIIVFPISLLLLSVREKSTVGNAVICPGEISLGIAFAQLGTQSTFASLQKKNWKKKLFANAKFFLYAIMLVIRYYWMMKFCLFSKHAKNKHSADTQFSQKPCKIFCFT